jgi:PAS domain S-box-containing protein
MDAAITAGVRDVLGYWSLAVLVCDAHGGVLDCNVHAQRILMMSRIELMGARIQDLLPGIDFLIMRTPTECIAKRRRVHECAVEVVVHNEGERYVAVFTDTTGAERRTQELIKMWESAIDGIITINRFGFIESFNLAAERISGYRAEEVVGSNVAALMPERYARNHDEYIGAYLNTGIRHVIGLCREVVLRCKDGVEEPVELSVTEFSMQGSMKFVGTVRSLADRHASEMQLRGIARDKLNFLAAICHEIRTPINGVVCATELLRDHVSSAEARGYLDTLDACSNILKNITRDTLDYAKLEGRKLEISPTTFNLKAMLDSLHAQYTLMVKDKSIMLDLYADFDTNIDVVADDLRIAQVLNNLASNAIKFTDIGGSVRIAVSRKLRTDKPNTVDLLFTVSDTGVGVPPEMLPRLFRPFSQGGNSRMNRYAGTGLGLSICKSLVTLMGGAIGMYNNTNEAGDVRGASFNFSVPVTVAAMPAQKTAPTHATVKRSGLRVLLVEDNFINQTLIRKMLERRGIKKDDIVVAANGLEAIEVVQGLRSPPGQPFLADLVLMDCQMPVMNGFDAARRIRAIGLALPIIALTASTIKEDIDECYASGMNYYLSKPVNINELINIINSLTADQGSEYA